MSYIPAEDSFLLVKQVKAKAPGKSVLDMGAGWGILAETAMQAKCKSILAADINPEHVAYVQSKGISAVQSDLFSNIKGKFDLIVFNPPYLPEDELEDAETRQLVSGGKHGYEILARFLKDAKSHLNKSSEILFVFSSLTNKKKLEQILKKHRYTFACLEQEEHFFETLYVYCCH